MTATDYRYKNICSVCGEILQSAWLLINGLPVHRADCQAVLAERERIIAIVESGIGCDVKDHQRGVCECKALVQKIREAK